MRVLFTYENSLPRVEADAEQWVNSAAALARAGHEVELVFPRRPGESAPTTEALLEHFQVDGPLRFRALPTGHRLLGLQHARHAAAVARDPRTRTYDVVHTRNLGVLTACLHAGHRCAFEHYRPWGDQFPPLQPWVRHALGHPDCVAAFFHSELARASYPRLGVPGAKLVVLHNGHQPQRAERVRDAHRARRALGLPVDAELVVYTGRINAKKGLDVALAMARALRARGTHFVLVGSEGEGPLERRARSMPNVHVRPWQPYDRVLRYLDAADVLLVPPSQAPLERYGNTVLPLKLFSYLAAGRPILAPRSADLVGFLDDGVDARLVRPADATDVREPVAALVELLDDAALRERLAQGALRRAADLSWDARGERLGEHLARACAAEPVPAGDGWTPRAWLGESGRWLARGVLRGRWVGSMEVAAPAR
ncbi:MAG: glycosyl transferase [Sandaracinus sp.]|nr:glycosyl transferase [Sandaracinus sp.]